MQATEPYFASLLENVTELADFDIFMEVLTRKRNTTSDRIEAYSTELFRFLYLKSLSLNLSPSPIIDRCWHCLLLMPQLYKKVCKLLQPAKTVTGIKYEDGIIPHDPLGGDNRFARNKRYLKTLSQYAIHFPSGPLVAEVWPQVYPCDSEDSEDVVSVGTKRPRSAAAASCSVEISEAKLVEANTSANTSSSSSSSSSSAGERITIKLIDHSSRGKEETPFTIWLTTPFIKIMQVFADRKGVSVDVLRFQYDGVMVFPQSTAKWLEMRDGDKVDVMQSLRGC